MDGDSGDEGNDELTCVRSDESDKSSWSVGTTRQAKFLGKLIPETGWCVTEGPWVTFSSNIGIKIALARQLLKAVVDVPCNLQRPERPSV